MNWFFKVFACLKPKQVEPDRPLNYSEILTKEKSYEIPRIEVLPIKIQTGGAYKTSTKKARGLVVHYTAGRSLLGRSNAVSTLQFLADQGLGCMVMDKDGIIYRAENQDLDVVGFHAGNSLHKGETGISRFCMGMEICNAGKLDVTNKSWFGEVYEESQLRSSLKKDNIFPGKYHKFTDAQESALINFLRWQLDVNPEFRLSWIVGHDEIAIPNGRKTDPGASLSMSMPELRALLGKG